MSSFKSVVCDKLLDISFVKNNFSFLCERKYVITISVIAFLLIGVYAIYSHFKVCVSEDSNMLSVSSLSLTTTSSAMGKISIPTGMVKKNPFLPYRTIEKEVSAGDVPNYTLVEPPEVLNESSEAARVMDTIVSGILYDKYSPSAILNIEGIDYLVKQGDVVNNYSVLNISKDSVTVKLGKNTYKAGIGEILTEGTINKNDVSNLQNKFGGKKI